MDLGIKGKQALVLASSQGLGLGIATKLCEEGANVIISSRVEDKLVTVVKELNNAGPGTADHVVADLSEEDSAGKLYAAAKDKLGGIDILVNNTGGPPPGTVDKPDTDLWLAQIGTMLIRVIEITNLCVADMKEAGWGRVLTVASSGVVQPIANLAMSNTIRSSLVGWSKSLSTEVASSGITVNMLLPGRILTERLAQLDKANAERLGKTVEEVSASEQAAIPVGRYGTVEEFGSVGAFLCSAPASYMTGGLIRCDGGSIRGV
ncbi:MAG: SDR family oxidoreductase [Candidatus Marinimicrobia bacterium]|jgi:3-oxoacyl-[acyl-carrier protein] reductase|nr:SDR family oxidoreductase [Candidatus Neomarinimicrobiota bacterium]MDP7060339.1 SDR family oxidoreductase [Candidatus Neomarinimicrobiota bacterium]|tara:strand:+ start:4279 stop:5067 length:789 start_codon:yes stop_codon:yes gene_type:complete